MGNIDDTYTFFLKVIFKDVQEPIFIKIRKKESERFEINMESFNETRKSSLFFVCDTIDGKYIGINIAQIQSVNILWEPSPHFEDLKYYEGPIKFLLKGRKEMIETNTEDPDELHDFYSYLEYGSDIVGTFAGFTDEDGERLLINIHELLYIESPQSLTDEGWQIVKKRDGIET
ncbi:MAG: hypothetical protein U9P10_08445 [Thermodesulfobacteriota bacterium]|nr:hypothetical protein [Thermodesulfobacteriota bacterium]